MQLHLQLLVPAFLGVQMLQKGVWSQEHYSGVTQPGIGDDLRFCSNSDCGQIGYERIQKVYGKLFMTEEEVVTQRYIKKRRSHVVAYNETDSFDVLPGDGDSCCATELVYTQNTTVVDVSGNQRTIVHFPPRYQYLPRVTCVATGCHGTCIVEPLYLTLLVYTETGTPDEDEFTLEWFSLPGYCSCKNIT